MRVLRLRRQSQTMHRYPSRKDATLNIMLHSTQISVLRFVIGALRCNNGIRHALRRDRCRIKRLTSRDCLHGWLHERVDVALWTTVIPVIQ